MLKIELNKIYNEECLSGMNRLPDKSIDMILCDLPYGTSSCRWDMVIPFEPLWEQYNRIIKDNGVIILFGSEPFSSHLRMSNIKNYRYDWMWLKTKPSGHLNAKKQPMRKVENIMVFYSKQPTYNPQDLIYGQFNNNRKSRATKIKGEYVHGKEREIGISNATNYPTNVLEYPNPNNKTVHPTQKPIELCEYLIKTYTNENEIVLDNCIGSGTTAIACINTKRNYIGFELDEKYFHIASERVDRHKRKK